MASCLITISLFSFVISVLLSFGFRLVPLPTRFAFFGTPARIWEFGVGIILALALPFIDRASELKGIILGAIGVSALLLASSRI
ncbi:MAG: hypothetical protein ACYC0U_05360, partial [Ilumatobacteraceae bacterium]